jgi:hypothetical protein
MSLQRLSPDHINRLMGQVTPLDFISHDACSECGQPMRTVCHGVLDDGAQRLPDGKAALMLIVCMQKHHTFCHPKGKDVP